MYHTAGIAPLSQTQVSKLLNHHSVRVKAGTHHKIGLSKEQMKKHHKAQIKGTGYNLTLDPFQVANMQYLRHEVNKAKRAGKKDPKATIGFGATEYLLAEELGKQLFKGKGGRMNGKGTGKDLGKALANNVATIANAGTTRAVNAIIGTDKGNESSYSGGKINRINKFNRWMGALGGVAQDVGDFIKPVAKPILEAATQRAVNEINPTSPADYLQIMAGLGVKKSRGRPKKGGDLAPAGSHPALMGRGKKKKAPRKKKAMHFAI